LPRGSLINFGGALHSESFMRTLVVKLANESVELGLLLKEVRTGRPRSFDFQGSMHAFMAAVGVSRGLRRNVPVKHDDFALLILIIRGADMNLN